MAHCSNCQSNLDDEAIICEFCGYNLSSQEFEPRSNESDLRCYICNNKAEGSCAKCGKEVCNVHLTAMSSTEMNSGILRTTNLCSTCAKQRSDRNKIYKFLIFAIALIMILLMLFVFFTV